MEATDVEDSDETDLLDAEDSDETDLLDAEDSDETDLPSIISSMAFTNAKPVYNFFPTSITMLWTTD